MAVIVSCPRCTHKNTIEDAKAKQPVHCRICHHLLSPGASVPPEQTPAAAPTAVPTVALVKEGPPPVVADARRGAGSRTADPERATPPPPSKGRRRPGRADRDDRSSSEGGGAAIAFWVLGGVGALLLLVVCAGIPAVYFLLIRRAADQVGQAVAVQPANPLPNFQPPPQNFQPLPPVNPFPVVPAAPVPPPLNPNDPAAVGEALAALKEGGQKVGPAITWLKQADPNNPRRDEVAKALEGMVEEQKQVVFSNDQFFAAYFRWATKENVPSLLKMAEDPTFTVDANHRRQKAMETLGKFKEERAVDVIASKLGNPFDGGVALRALEDMGPVATKALLKYMNHPDNGVRSNARRLLLKHAQSDAMLQQTITDLSAADPAVRNSAVEWLSQAPVNEKLRPEVAKAIDPLIGDANSLQGSLARALEIWGTAENAPRVEKALEANPLDGGGQIRLLATLKSPGSIPVIASRLGRLFDGAAARDALKQYGKEAEPEVAKLLGSADRNVRLEACRLLASVGTVDVGIPALEAAAKANATDSEFVKTALRSVKSIRAKASR
jgi:hypothetical protein